MLAPPSRTRSPVVGQKQLTGRTMCHPSHSPGSVQHSAASILQPNAGSMQAAPDNPMPRELTGRARVRATWVRGAHTQSQASAAAAVAGAMVIMSGGNEIADVPAPLAFAAAARVVPCIPICIPPAPIARWRRTASSVGPDPCVTPSLQGLARARPVWVAASSVASRRTFCWPWRWARVVCPRQRLPCVRCARGLLTPPCSLAQCPIPYARPSFAGVCCL